MAKKIETVKKWEWTEEEKRTQELREIEDALIENKEAIFKTLDILNEADNKGLLNMVSGLLHEGENVLQVAVKTMNKPETTNTIRNVLLMMGTASLINVQELEPLLLKINKGIEQVAEKSDTDEKTGYFDMARSLKDPEINRALTIMLAFLKGMGAKTEDEMRSKEKPVDQKV
ncbi:DUF1641 domain-containing protein [Bacillus piscicola]|uniref:DUF1641 domain-containing protein n=1 Tax=Bacillus piscicola TaxID=1632684 RepID=UPI001F09C234|nr:DUF1641 domain-containing protein [Bacillus piscicola]